MRTIHHGFSMPPVAMMLGMLIMFGGFALIIVAGNLLGLAIAIIMAAAGTWMVTSTYGVQIDHEHKRFREYGAVFWFLKYGKWKNQADYPHMSILGSRKTATGTSYAGVTTSIETRTVDLYFLTENHRGKVAIKEFPNSEKAIEFALELKELTGTRLVKFSPEISEKTMARRRR